MKQTKSKKSMKQFLTLALAFVMVFTGMGIGSWGVDTAWADTQITVDGAALEEITGSKYSDDVDVFLAKVDENAKAISLSIDSSYYIRVESSFSLEPTYASESIYSQTAWYNSAEAYVAYDGCGSANVEDLLAGYDGYDSIEDYLMDNYECSTAEEYIEQQVGGTLQDAWSEVEYKTIPYNNGAYTVTLPDVNASINASTFSQYFGNSSKSYDATAKRYYLFELCQDINGILGRTADCKAVVLVQVGGGLTIDCDRLNAAIAQAVGIKAADYHAQNDGYNGKKSINDLRKELAANETIKKDTAILNKISSKEAPITSFWGLYEAAMERVNEIYPAGADGVRSLKDGISQSQVDAAAELLKLSIANLIPTSQLNATKLYEALRPVYWEYGDPVRGESVRYDHITFEDRGGSHKVSADNCTQASWAAYTRATEPAAAYLTKLFDENGNATAFNKAEAAKGDQLGETEADKLADAIDPTQLVNQKTYDEVYQNWKTREAEAASLLVQYDPTKLTETAYTPVSWKTYADTYQALKDIAEYRIVGGTKADYDMLKNFYQNGDWLTNLLPQSYNKLESREGVTVTLQYTNGLAAAYPAVRGNGTDAYSGEISLAKGSTTVEAALAQIKITVHIGTGISGVLPKVTGSSFDSASEAWFAVYINDEFRGVYQNVGSLSKVYLKNGDSIRVNRIVQPLFESEDSSGTDSSKIYRLRADMSMYQDSAAMIQIDSITSDLKVGDKAKLQLSLKDAYGTDSGTQRSAEGITLFVSETPGKTKDTAGQPTRKTIAVTNASGSAEYVFAEEGWYWVAAHNVTPDKYYFQNIYRETTDGTYYSLQCSDAMLVYVRANKDESALIAAQRNENLAKAKAFYESFQAHDFPEGYYAGDFKIAYENLKTHQNGATTFKALMDRFEADYADLQLCVEQKLDHDARIASLRENLSYVPEDLLEFNDGDKDFIESVQHAYADLNDYEKTLLTPREITKLDEIAAIDVEKLTIRASVNLVENASTLPLNTDSTQGAAQFGFENNKWLTQPNPDGTLSDPDWVNGVGWKASLSKAGNYVFIRKFLKPTDKEYWMVWSIDGWKTTNLAEPQTLKSVHGVAFDGYFLVKYQIPKDITDGSTITFDLKMVDKETYENLAGIAETPKEIAAAKNAALASLETAYQAYDEANYIPDNWTALTAAYEKGRTDIEAAATSEAAADARKAAIAAMATIAAKGGSENPSVTDYDSGKTVGKVSVTIENTKYAGGAFTGTIASGQYDLGENDSMMTCVLKALKQAGYTWNGTAGSSKDKLADYSITYLSLIQKGGKSLGEFDGNSRSGWMGTLNDWFTNEGFSAFTVKNGQLENGDEIHVMFTMDYGADLGGTWNNNNTKLAGLTISGGTLSPAFSGSQTDYTLIISGDKANVSVTPTAANKNYQARIFLNRYNQDSARYKRTESISVKSGDVFYVGVGESGWPTMNASSVGTKYTIKVVSGSDSTAVDKMLKALKKITYANYKAEKGNVEAARAAYNALDAKGKQAIAAADLKKLTDAEAQIKFYSEIDDAKAKLAALPKLTNPTKEQANAYRSQINAATAAYNKLSKEQKQYITTADVENYNALAAVLGVEAIAGAAEMPESPVSTTGEKGSATTSAPTDVKVSEKTKADGTKETVAEVKVDAAHHDEIIKQAAENKSAEIVLEVEKTDTKGADSVQLSLDVTFVKNVADKTNADLTVNTENGKVTLDQETIKTVLAEAKGATITLEVIKVSKPTEVQKKAAGANGHLLKLTIKSGDRVISDFNKGKVKVVAEIVSKLLNKKVAAIHIAEDGKIEQLAGKVLTIGGKKYFEFTTPHFSTFALVDADELGLEVKEEPAVDVKTLTVKLTPVARSAKTAKKNVKVTVSLDKQDKAIIKELKDAGYTVKYRFYRSTKKAAGYKAAVTKKTASYTNTSGKKGTKYFYKVQVRVYDENGKLAAKTALKQCRYAARVWSK